MLLYNKWSKCEMNKIIYSSLVAFFLSGCAEKVTISPIGGSKADGTIKMGYSYKIFEKPIVDFDTANVLAVQKCKVWGYDGAEAFGGQTMICSMPSIYGCEIKTVSIDYQCTGNKASNN